MIDRFASAETKTVTLPDGADWIEIKAELTYAEEKRLSSGSLRQSGTTEDGEPLFRVDLAAYGVDLLSAWLVDWSFTRAGADGNRVRVPLTRDAIAALAPETGKEIEAILDAHVAELQAKKATQATTQTATVAA
jgi:hypothetical protein